MNYSGWARRPRVFGDFYRRDILYGNAGLTGIRGEPKTTAERRQEGLHSREEVRQPESTYLPVGLLLNPRSQLMDSSSLGRCIRTYDTNRPAPASSFYLSLMLPSSSAFFPKSLPYVSHDDSTVITFVTSPIVFTI